MTEWNPHRRTDEWWENFANTPGQHYDLRRAGDDQDPWLPLLTHPAIHNQPALWLPTIAQACRQHDIDPTTLHQVDAATAAAIAATAQELLDEPPTTPSP